MKFFWSKPVIDNSEQEYEQPDYSSFSKDQLLDSFKSENWVKLSEEKRIAVVQEIENRTAPEQGRPVATVVSSNDSDCYGAYTSTSNSISINISDFSSYEVLDTYVHESNHAYQSYCIETGEGYDNHTLSMMEAEMARDERGNLYNYAQTSPEYDMQCDELDSNNKAATFLLEQRERYENDPAYRAYIEERANHFNEVNSSIENCPDDRCRLQNDQAHIAYVKGDITQEQYTLLSNDINNNDFQDITVVESKKIGTYMDTLNKEYQSEKEQAIYEDKSGNTDYEFFSVMGEGQDLSGEYSENEYDEPLSEGSQDLSDEYSENEYDEPLSEGSQDLSGEYLENEYDEPLSVEEGQNLNNEYGESLSDGETTDTGESVDSSGLSSGEEIVYSE